MIARLVASVPADQSIFLLGRYSFDDYYLSFMYQSMKEGNRFYYLIGNRKVEFLTVHKSKGLEADYVILLQCNKDTYGFPSRVSDDPTLQHVLTKSDQYPYGEERRLFYVAITRAKVHTWVLYDRRFPSVLSMSFSIRNESMRRVMPNIRMPTSDGPVEPMNICSHFTVKGKVSVTLQRRWAEAKPQLSCVWES